MTLKTKTHDRFPTPIGDVVLIRRIVDDKRDGLYMPDSAKEIGTTAEVVAINPNATHALTPGDIVHVSKYAGVPIQMDGFDENEIVYVKTEFVLGIISHKGAADADAK